MTKVRSRLIAIVASVSLLTAVAPSANACGCVVLPSLINPDRDASGWPSFCCGIPRHIPQEWIDYD
jgi:hypothetical protein